MNAMQNLFKCSNVNKFPLANKHKADIQQLYTYSE